MPMTGKELLRKLHKLGIAKVKGGGKGGHQEVLNPQNNRTSEVPMHGESQLNGELSKNLEHKILKQLGLI